MRGDEMGWDKMRRDEMRWDDRNEIIPSSDNRPIHYSVV